MLPRVAPFALFMAWIGLEEILRTLVKRQILTFDPDWFYWLYPPKALLVGLLLILLRHSYDECTLKDLLNRRQTLLSIISGGVVFVLWIKMDWTIGPQSQPTGFNPGVFQETSLEWLMIGIRVAGAVIIVPIMEELFWRSFLLRYLINADFSKVAIGRFSLFSFLSVSVLFGLEHHYIFAGIMAGVIFNCVYYYSRSIIQCILSHAVANLCLALYVLDTGKWNFW